MVNRNMCLTEQNFQLFDREVKQFFKLKQMYPLEEIEAIKRDYKTTWDLWKAINLSAYEELQTKIDLMKPKVESWTNGWQVRGHYWVSYRSIDRQSDATCIGILLNRKNLRINLLWQKYKEKQSEVSASDYNEKLNRIPEWAKTVNPEEYFIWTSRQEELDDYISLATYLESPIEQARIETELAEGETFKVGRVIPKQVLISEVNQLIAQSVVELYPLYEA
ncbi:HI_0552 family protein [Carnobacterium gallinarum]|uniref:HI_0552 family protein n=1 Tax=Carnobacterium gallinarum TaxID=2749 RepID=UPI000552F69A|nr:HI_0552 family protein [Carnobacterium gallinarum]